MPRSARMPAWSLGLAVLAFAAAALSDDLPVRSAPHIVFEFAARPGPPFTSDGCVSASSRNDLMLPRSVSNSKVSVSVVGFLPETSTLPSD